MTGDRGFLLAAALMFAAMAVLSAYIVISDWRAARARANTRAWLRATSSTRRGNVDRPDPDEPLDAFWYYVCMAAIIAILVAVVGLVVYAANL